MKAAVAIIVIVTTVAIRYFAFIVYLLFIWMVYPYNLIKLFGNHTTLKTNALIRQDADE